jgi:hypothetical protein
MMVGRSSKKRSVMEGKLRTANAHVVTLAMALAILVFYLILGEVFSRSDIAHNLFITPDLGGKYRGFVEQLNRLDTFVSGRDDIDCIFLGDSTVMSDFSPSVFSKSFYDQTGSVIDCFNFGVGDSNVVGSAALAKILIDEYHPKLLIYGIHILNYATPGKSEGAAAILESPWVQYKLGYFSMEGWLYEHSYLYRYLDTYGKLADLGTNYNELLRRGETYMPEGYYPMEGQGPFDLTNPPDPASQHPYDEHYFTALGNFKVDPTNLEALRQIADLQSANTQIIAVEMPVSDTFYYYLDGGRQEYSLFVEEIRKTLSENSTGFLQVESLLPLPSNLWFNRNHLNTEGAEQFSKWLGERLGEAVAEGKVSLPSG